ncbi:hypothetical protein SASPL_141717 [Salvia splendens]|uniref:non-specific serine/threonine protein kinase n=1 Tax=Salvia splendens TaxID=180675 RepID=A0A8X8Z941_SALSN|nr:hypothetical protein SASPL_141717 [Salvia splendens]
MFASRLIALIWFLGFANYVASACLPPLELEALSVVASKLGKRDWNLDGEVDPCSNDLPWWDVRVHSGVYCNKTSNGNGTTTCHVTRIILKKNNLNGSLPIELVGLPSLDELDLTRNFLNGSLPPDWSSMGSLRIISVLGNRLSGPIPKEYGSITSLEELVLEANQFTGNVPGEIGDLPRIRRLLLNSNNFTGELPPSLAKLTTLKDFRISDNNFTGSVPNYIQNWINIERMEIQASGLSGPIPSNFSALINLTDLRISDLNGIQSDFPILDTSTDWQQVILRSCNIVGELPGSIAQLKIDKSLLRSEFQQISRTNSSKSWWSKRRNVRVFVVNRVRSCYLTGNFLNGTVPQSMEAKGNINLFANSNGNTSEYPYCVNPQCMPNDFYFFHINCGSNKNYGDYQADSDSPNFYQAQGENWGFSSTGKFWNPETYGESLFASNDTSGPESNLYSTARLSPLSLTYYGFCLRNGNYNVNLHFAEIMFTSDTTYGRRVFDIYIQGELVEKDFNIVNVAGAVNKPKIMPYPAFVGDHNLEIRFYWAGKGTTSLPDRSVYGPLISAISVVHATYKPGTGSISTGAKVGIAMAAICALVLLVAILRLKGCLGGKHSMHHDLKGLDLRTGKFTLRQIRAATNNFDPANKIGEGGFGPVYKGVLLDKTIIAVKQLSSKSKQGNREFVNEIGMISALQHPHLVKLYGCCIEGNQLLLVYEYLENNSLARALFGYLTDKADVYSFGIVVLEIVSGRGNSSIRPKEDSFYLLDWANSLKARGNLLELVDQRLETSFNKEEITRAINVALICTNVVAAERPSMSAVVSILEGKDGVPKFVSESSFSAGKTKPDGVEMSAFDSEVVSADAPWSGSSTSAADLYPVALDTNYWEKRGL